AAYGPKEARAGPCHAVEKAAAIDSVVFVVVRNVIGHNIGFSFGCLEGCLTPVFTGSAGFYSRNLSDQSASPANFPQFLLGGCYFRRLSLQKRRVIKSEDCNEWAGANCRTSAPLNSRRIPCQ